MSAYIYLRVSTPSQSKFTEGHVSLETQEDTCNEYCNKKGWKVAETVREIGSARNIEKLREHKRLVRSMPSGSKLVVYNISRFSRNLLQGLVVADKLRKRDIEVVSAVEGCSYSGGVAERHLFNTTMCFTEHQSAVLSDNIRRNVAYRRRMGHRIGTPPYGKRAVRQGGNNIRIFIDDPAEIQVIQFIKKELRRKQTATNIAETLNSRGLRKRGAVWDAGRVKSVILRYDHIKVRSLAKALPTLDSDGAGSAYVSKTGRKRRA